MDGIFAVRVRGVGNGHAPDKALPGVASLGTRPTVGGTVPLLEAHVFEFDGDLYGREIEVEFIARLRDELKFDSARRHGRTDASRCGRRAQRRCAMRS